MSTLLDAPPYATRDDAVLLAELEVLTAHHRTGCGPYARLTRGWRAGGTLAELPFVHVGLLKDVLLRTEHPELRHQRLLASSATTSGISSKVALDERSSALQSRSTAAILAAWLGEARRPLVVLDDARSLRGRGDLGARLAAALSLRPLATDTVFVLPDPADPASLRWDAVLAACERGEELLVYGFTWVLWLAWARGSMPAEVRERLRGTRLRFVHSGGWKKLEALRVDRATFDGALLANAAAGSSVLDYYGLVEQVGVIFPLCEAGARHVPRWADVLVRDPWTLASLPEGEGQLQFVNPLAWGAPYHSVLTEDVGRLLPGACPCGRDGRRFTLAGRIPKAEVRGCANV